MVSAIIVMQCPLVVAISLCKPNIVHVKFTSIELKFKSLVLTRTFEEKKVLAYLHYYFVVIGMDTVLVCTFIFSVDLVVVSLTQLVCLISRFTAQKQMVDTLVFLGILVYV